MRLPLVRFTLGRMMLAVAVLAFSMVVLSVIEIGCGVLITSLALIRGFVCWKHDQGATRRFWLGYEFCGLATVLIFIGFIHVPFFGGTFSKWPLDVLKELTDFLLPIPPASRPGTSNGSTFVAILTANISTSAYFIFDLFFAIPMLLIAWVGGRLALFLGSSRQTPGPDTTPADTRGVGNRIASHPLWRPQS